MAKLTRWEPFREMVTLREAMDRLFDDALTRPLTVFDGWAAPQVDLYETDREVVIKAVLPGLTPDKIEVSISGDLVTIRGTVDEEQVVDEATYHLRERRVGSLARTISLPVPVNADKSRAEFENGILTLTITKAEEVQPRMITVKAK